VVLLLQTREKLSKSQEEDVRQLLCQVRAKNGLTPSRINRALKRLDKETAA
jgi:uncharacterized protein YkwD